MPQDNSRIARAGNYILGLMSDAERERAERDLEVDTAFRDTVMQMAVRMHVFDPATPENDRSDDRWRSIAGRIAELPQMQFSVVGSGEASHMPYRQARKAHRIGLRPIPAARTAFIAIGLLMAFALGYLAGRW